MPPPPPTTLGSIISGVLTDSTSGLAVSSVEPPFAFLSLRKWNPVGQVYDLVNEQNCGWARTTPIEGCADEKGNFSFDQLWNGGKIENGIYFIRVEAWWPNAGISYFIEDRFIKVDGVNPGSLGLVYLNRSPIVLGSVAVGIEKKQRQVTVQWATTLKNARTPRGILPAPTN